MGLTDWSLVLGIVLIVLREMMEINIVPKYIGYQIISWFWPLPFLFFFRHLSNWSHAGRSETNMLGMTEPK